MAVNFSSVKLVKGGTIQGDDNATGSLTTTNTYYSFGGAEDMWGLALSDSDINAADFGAVVSFVETYTTHYLKATNFSFSIPEGATINGVLVEIKAKTDADRLNASVDHIRITVYYTEEAVGTNFQVQIGEAWKVVPAMQLQIGGAWKAVEGAQMVIDDGGKTWKTLF